jgi:hypothetical protein
LWKPIKAVFGKILEITTKIKDWPHPLPISTSSGQPRLMCSQAELITSLSFLVICMAKGIYKFDFDPKISIKGHYLCTSSISKYKMFWLCEANIYR